MLLMDSHPAFIDKLIEKTGQMEAVVKRQTQQRQGILSPRAINCRRAKSLRLYYFFARRCQVSYTVSGLSEIEAMPSVASQSAKSG